MPIRVTATVDPVSDHVEARALHGEPFVMDGDAAEGEDRAAEDRAAEPKETLLAALAGCTSMDVASILRKKRQRAAAYQIEVSGTSAEEHPRVFTAITVEHRVTGAVEPEALRRSIELSATKYCPVNAMLSAVATIEHRYHLTDERGEVHSALVAVTGPAGASVAQAPHPGHEAV
ncbi:MAG: OsmC family protein [Candidatus Limnocylindria bacterium]